MWTTTSRGRRKKAASEYDYTTPAEIEEFDGTSAELAAEIERLSELNRSAPDGELERTLLHYRNLLGVRRLQGEAPASALAAPQDGAVPEPADGLPELGPAGLTPGVVRAGILRHGCVLIRGLVPRATATAFAGQIERVYKERARHDADRSFNDRYYAPFRPDPRRGVRLLREWVKEGGGVLAVDSPRLSFEMGEMYRSAGLAELVEGYLGEPPMVAGDKTTLRRAEPQVSGAWHQDGKFMGPVKALNLWLALSDCGQEAPGLDLVPRRLDDYVTTQTDEVIMANQVSQRMAEEAAGGKSILRPIFAPGDALLFDELFLHKTASEPHMHKPRYAIENWFFGASAFPADYVPLAL
jgi:hypothetical protein